MGDQFSIIAEGQTVTFRTNGLGGSVVSTFTSGEESMSELFIEKESQATYNLNLFGDIVKNAPSVSDKVKIEFSTNLALRLDLLLPQGKLHFYMSPMLEES